MLGTTDRILADDLPEAVLEFDAESPGDLTSNFHDKVLQAKKEMIVEAMKQSKGNYTAAAKQLGLHPNYLHRLIRNLNLKEDLKV